MQDVPAQLKITITLEEATALTGISRQQLTEWMKDFDFPVAKIGQRGGKYIIHRESFNEWLRKRCESRLGLGQ